MRTVIVGNRKLSEYLLRKTISDGWDIVGAVTPKGEMAAAQANFEPVEEVVSGVEVSLHRTNDINSDRTTDWFQRMEPNVCLCGGWSQIIDESVLEIPDKGFLGFHSSKLPKGRGGAPVNWSLIDGSNFVWISLFYYTAGVDAGDVIDQRSVSVEPRDDVSTVFNKLTSEAGDIVVRLREKLKTGSINSKQQSTAEATYRPRRTPKDGLINWKREPVDQFNWIRAQTKPYPGAYTFYDGEKLRIWSAELVNKNPQVRSPGSVTDVIGGEGVDVQTGDGIIRITRAQVGNDPPMWADDVADSIGFAVGDQFGREQAPDDWLYTGLRNANTGYIPESNVEIDEHGAIKLVAYSSSGENISVTVRMNDSTVLKQDIHVDGEWTQVFDYKPDTTGENSLRISFVGDDYKDTRYHKIFVSS